MHKPLVSALPRNLPSPPTIAERIRAAKRQHMTRRDLTEQKIMRNVCLKNLQLQNPKKVIPSSAYKNMLLKDQMHSNPNDLDNFEVLYISNKQLRAKENEIYRENSRNNFPHIHHATK